jgi:hypothetical protein
MLLVSRMFCLSSDRLMLVLAALAHEKVRESLIFLEEFQILM